MTLTKKQAAIAATLCKIAFVEQVAKPVSKRDADFRAITSHAEIIAMIEALEAISK